MSERPDDELLSAILDGEATEAERRALESDPRARARLEELRMVRAALRSSPEPTGAPPARIAIEAALAEFDRRGETHTASRGAANATPITARRSRNRRRPSRVPVLNRGSIAGAAAAVLLAVVGIGLVARNGGGSSRDSTEAASFATTTAAPGDVSAPPAGAMEISPQAMDDSAERAGRNEPEAAMDSAADAAGGDSAAPELTTAAAEGTPSVDPDLLRCASDLGLISEEVAYTEPVDDSEPGRSLNVTTNSGERFRIRFEPTGCLLLDGPTPLP